MRFSNIILLALTITLLASCATSKKIRLADDLFEEGSYYNAVDTYEEAFQKKDNNSRLAFQIAETNRMLKDYGQAEKWYSKTLDLNESAWPEARFYYAQMLKAQEKYDDAIDSYQQYIDASEDKGKGADAEMLSELRKRAKVEKQGAELALELMAGKQESEVEHVENGLNNNLQDFSPKYMSESQVLMASLLPEEAVNLDEAQTENENYYAKLYYANNNGGSWERELLPEGINSSKLHVGNGVVSADGNTLYFTKCNELNAHQMECNIYMTKKSGDTWSEDADAISTINKKGSSSTQPAIGVDEEGNEILYFASNRTGSKGGFDIYYATIDEDGEFGSPTNLGSKVNTKWDELTPFYDHTNGLLYFSSEGHPGMGGLDVFKVEGNVASYEDDVEVINAGYPVNSGADDLYLALNESGSKGYMVSNREGAISTRGANCCDDVFKVKLKKEKFISIIAKDSSENVLTGVSVGLYSSIDGKFDLLGEGVTGKDKPATFMVENPSDFKINGEKEGFWPSITNVTQSELDNTLGDTLTRIIYLRPVDRVAIKNVYFAFDKSSIREMYKERMDTIITLLNKYEELMVQINGHTDSKGSDNYNQKLSEKRAKEAKAYFLEIGIKEERLLTKGLGEAEPIAPNENPDGTDNPEGRAKNRRVEFKLLNDVNEDLPINVEYQDDGPTVVE